MVCVSSRYCLVAALHSVSDVEIENLHSYAVNVALEAAELVVGPKRSIRRGFIDYALVVGREATLIKA